jgi:hypothetical protein
VSRGLALGVVATSERDVPRIRVLFEVLSGRRTVGSATADLRLLAGPKQDYGVNRAPKRSGPRDVGNWDEALVSEGNFLTPNTL